MTAPRPVTPAAPRYVVDSADQLTQVARRLAADGWSVQDGFTVPDDPWNLGPARLVVTGVVTGPATVAAAVLAAARGAGVVAVADTAGDVGRDLVADLARIGPVHGPNADGTGPPDDDGPTLSPELCALLERLAAGESIAQAAEAEYVSLRTANRRLVQARELLGVRTTREAVVEYVRQRSTRGDARG